MLMQYFAGKNHKLIWKNQVKKSVSIEYLTKIKKTFSGDKGFFNPETRKIFKYFYYS